MCIAEYARGGSVLEGTRVRVEVWDLGVINCTRLRAREQAGDSTNKDISASSPR